MGVVVDRAEADVVEVGGGVRGAQPPAAVAAGGVGEVRARADVEAVAPVVDDRRAPADVIFGADAAVLPVPVVELAGVGEVRPVFGDFRVNEQRIGDVQLAVRDLQDDLAALDRHRRRHRGALGVQYPRGGDPVEDFFLLVDHFGTAVGRGAQLRTGRQGHIEDERFGAVARGEHRRELKARGDRRQQQAGVFGGFGGKEPAFGGGARLGLGRGALQAQCEAFAADPDLPRGALRQLHVHERVGGGVALPGFFEPEVDLAELALGVGGSQWHRGVDQGRFAFHRGESFGGRVDPLELGVFEQPGGVRGDRLQLRREALLQQGFRFGRGQFGVGELGFLAFDDRLRGFERGFALQFERSFGDRAGFDLGPFFPATNRCRRGDNGFTFFLGRFGLAGAWRSGDSSGFGDPDLAPAGAAARRTSEHRRSHARQQHQRKKRDRAGATDSFPATQARPPAELDRRFLGTAQSPYPVPKRYAY